MVETLVTVGIVVILAALTTRAVQSSLNSAKDAQKVANLRNIGAAHGVYVAESEGKCLPANFLNTGDDPAIAGNARAWWPHYLLRTSSGGSKILQNPDFRLPNGSKQGVWDDVPNPSTGVTRDEQPGELCRVEAGFGWNWYQSSSTPGDQGDWASGVNAPRGSAALNAPSKLIVCLESMSVIAGPNPSAGITFEGWLGSVKVDPNFWAGPRWSNGTTTCLFFDGHVAQMKPDDFTVENFRPVN